jgi:hypothetical protein
VVTMGWKAASRPAACATAVEKGACPMGGAAPAAAAALQAAGGEGGLLTLRGGCGDRLMTLQPLLRHYSTPAHLRTAATERLAAMVRDSGCPTACCGLHAM